MKVLDKGKVVRTGKNKLKVVIEIIVSQKYITRKVKQKYEVRLILVMAHLIGSQAHLPHPLTRPWAPCLVTPHMPCSLKCLSTVLDATWQLLNSIWLYRINICYWITISNNIIYFLYIHIQQVSSCLLSSIACHHCILMVGLVFISFLLIYPVFNKFGFWMAALVMPLTITDRGENSKRALKTRMTTTKD